MNHISGVILFYLLVVQKSFVFKAYILLLFFPTVWHYSYNRLPQAELV